MLKYSTKQNPTGSLRLAPNQLLALGFEQADVYRRAVALRSASTQIYQPAQLALIATDTPTFRISSVTMYVNILPPDARLTRRKYINRFASAMRLDDQGA